VPDGSIGFNLMFGTNRDLEELRRISITTLTSFPAGRRAKEAPEPALPQKAQDTHLKSASDHVRVDIESSTAFSIPSGS